MPSRSRFQKSDWRAKKSWDLIKWAFGRLVRCISKAVTDIPQEQTHGSGADSGNSRELFSLRARKLRMQKCTDYETYKQCVNELDYLTGREEWKNKLASSDYDYQTVLRRKNLLCSKRESQDIAGLAGALKLCLHGHYMDIFQENLYSRTYSGTKALIEEYVAEVCDCLEFLRQNVNGPYSNYITDALHHVSCHWGCTSLILSGGCMLGFHHFGLCETLLRTSCNLDGSLNEPAEIDSIKGLAVLKDNLLPNVICGTSAGAVVAAWLGTRTDDELIKELNVDFLSKQFAALEPNNWFLRIWNVMRRGYMCDVSHWISVSTRIFGCITFLEAFERTGRNLNISMTRADCDAAPLVLNYKNAPNIVISSAVLCSSSFPFLAYPLHLKEKSASGELIDSADYAGSFYHDGSLSGDVPINLLRDLWGVTFTVVSQVNLHVFPFSGLRAHGEAGMPVAWRRGKWRAGFIMSGLEVFFKENIRFLLRYSFVDSLIALLDVSPTYRGINCGNLALQSYTGDVTVHPRSISWRYYKLGNDLNASDVKWYIQEGRNMTYPKVALIMNRMRIERALERLHAAAFESASTNRSEQFAVQDRTPPSTAFGKSGSADNPFDDSFLVRHSTADQRNFFNLDRLHSLRMMTYSPTVCRQLSDGTPVGASVREVGSFNGSSTQNAPSASSLETAKTESAET